MKTNQKQISVVYKNRNTIPVNRQAVHEFFYDHESVKPDFSGNRPNYNVSIKHFKKAISNLREPSDRELINLVDYERICSAIRRSKKENLPYKYKKLINYVMRIANCNKKLSILVINKMRDERFIQVIGDYVEYF